jgi:hypothetical protein
VAIVARLLPRHWDGRRLLQFLTGLALIALAFAVPALLESGDQPVDSPVTVITTVDTPLAPGLPIIEGPARAGAAEAPLALSAPKPESADIPLGVSGGGSAQRADSADKAATASGSADAARSGNGTGTAHGGYAAGAVQGLAALPVQGRHGGRICVEARRAAAGSTPRAHTERGPPTA